MDQAAVKYLCLSNLLPLKITNVYCYLRRHYGASAMKLYFEYVKVHLRIQTIRNDLLFIRTCRREELIPTFARIRIANPHLRYTKVHYECSQRILQAELKYKKRLLTHTHRHATRLKSMLKDLCLL